jgi:hypothetical protein
MIDNVLQKLRLEAQAKGDSECAHPETSVVTKNDLQTVRKEKCHPVTRSDPSPDEPVCQVLSESAELGVGVAFIFENQSSVSGEPGAGVA